MVRACYMGWACNVLRNIDPNFIVHYFVHGSKSCGLVLVNASSNRSGEFSDCTGFPVVAVFLQIWRLAAVLSISWQCFWLLWVLYAAGVLQTRTNEGYIGLTFNILWTAIKITSDETKGPVNLPCNVLFMYLPGVMKTGLANILTFFATSPV